MDANVLISKSEIGSIDIFIFMFKRPKGTKNFYIIEFIYFTTHENRKGLEKYIVRLYTWSIIFVLFIRSAMHKELKYVSGNYQTIYRADSEIVS